MSPLTNKPKHDSNYKRYTTAFNYFLISAGFSFLFAIGILCRVKGLMNKDIASFLIVTSFVFIFGFSLAGLVMGIRSFVKNEENHFKKQVGLFGNLIFVGLFCIGLIVNFLDVVVFLTGS